MLTIGSLFSGIGGIEIGLERTRQFKTIWQCEIAEYPSAVLAEKFPGVPNYGDITKVRWEDVKRPDVICGGFPCQDISIAGKGAGIIKGERSKLWSEYARAIRTLRPRYALIENVPELANRGLWLVLADLAEMGYDAEWKIISAAEVGAPHKRERLFIIAHTNNGCKQRDEIQSRRNSVESEVNDAYSNSCGQRAGKDNWEERHILPTEKREDEKSCAVGSGRLFGDDKRINAETADPNNLRLEREGSEQQTAGTSRDFEISNTASLGCGGRSKEGVGEQKNDAEVQGRSCEDTTADNFSECVSLSEEQVCRFSEFQVFQNIRRIEDLRNRPDIPEPLIRRISNGFPKGLDGFIWRERIKALGNAVVPACAEKAGRRIIEIENEKGARK
jgi:DNA (cytosine-5)-methyltransferase 1